MVATTFKFGILRHFPCKNGSSCLNKGINLTLTTGFVAVPYFSLPVLSCKRWADSLSNPVPCFKKKTSWHDFLSCGYLVFWKKWIWYLSLWLWFALLGNFYWDINGLLSDVMQWKWCELQLLGPYTIYITKWFQMNEEWNSSMGLVWFH